MCYYLFSKNREVAVRRFISLKKLVQTLASDEESAESLREFVERLKGNSFLFPSIAKGEEAYTFYHAFRVAFAWAVHSWRPVFSATDFRRAMIYFERECSSRRGIGEICRFSFYLWNGTVRGFYGEDATRVLVFRLKDVEPQIREAFGAAKQVARKKEKIRNVTVA